MAETAISTFGSIDVLVNAGIFFIKPFTDYTTGDFKRLVSTIQIGRGLIDSARPRCNERK